MAAIVASLPETLKIRTVDDQVLEVTGKLINESAVIKQIYDKCILAIFNEFSGQAVTPQRRGDLIYYQFYDTAHSWCPRDVVNGRQKFVINELPKCPVIVNDASLPKHQEASSTPRTKWVIVICVVLLVLFLASVILGICIYMYFKKDHVLAVKPVPQRSKSPNTRTSHRKTSPALSPMNL
uniref:ZP domain-containing protein n=1 Tax=Panagrellus redivivus TaxID=6233 RepID=A0A7E5A0T6_PANRE